MESKISYDPLWKMLKEHGMKKMEFADKIGISYATLAKLGKDEPVTLTTVKKICDYFNCYIEDVVEYVPAKESETMGTDTVEIYKVLDQFYKIYKRTNGIE